MDRISEEKMLGHYFIQMSFEQEEISSAEYSGIVENLFFFQVTSRTEAKSKFKGFIIGFSSEPIMKTI